jgi:hypothetical protein
MEYKVHYTKGFRDELLSQDPEDETASALLERIKHERDNTRNNWTK